MLLAIRPDLAAMDRAEPGFTGDPAQALDGLFAGSVKDLTAVGVIGDPTRASAAHGEGYWALAVELVLTAIGKT